MLLQHSGLLKLCQFCAVDIQGREPLLDDFSKYSFYIGLRSDAYEPISFKFAAMTDTTYLYVSFRRFCIFSKKCFQYSYSFK